jgi:hypothetical protein
LFTPAPHLRSAAVDPGFHDLARAEDQHPARGDRHLLPGLRVAPDAAALVAHHEGAERRQLDPVAGHHGLGNGIDDRLHKLGRFSARQPDLAMHSLAEIGSRQRLSSHGVPLDPTRPEA